MANFNRFFLDLLKLEGGYVNDPLDTGGATKYGITLETWRRFGFDKNQDFKITDDDVKLITIEDAALIAKRQYWDFFQADKIENQSVAEFIVDWGYNSGVVTAAMKVQKILGLKVDGVFGPKTLRAINAMPAKILFDTLQTERREFVKEICLRRPTQKKFLKGWIDRIYSFQFKGNVNKSEATQRV